VDTILQDLRYGVRMLRRSPAVALVAIASLGIGIGGAAAVFALADALLVRELPVKDPRQLALFRWASGRVSVFESLNGNAQRNEQDFSVSSTSFSRPAFDAMRTELAGRADVFGFAELYRVNMSLDGRADVANGHVVSGNYYSALGLSAADGRLIADSDDRSDAPPVAVLSYAFWQRRFAGASALGRQLVLNGVSFTVVGVAPKGFRGTLQIGQDHDVIVPMASYDAVYRERSTSPNYWWVLVMARVAPGVALEQLQSQTDLIVKRTTAAARRPPGASPSRCRRNRRRRHLHCRTRGRPRMSARSAPPAPPAPPMARSRCRVQERTCGARRMRSTTSGSRSAATSTSSRVWRLSSTCTRGPRRAS